MRRGIILAGDAAVVWGQGRHGIHSVLKALGYFNPLYDPLVKHIRLSDPAREFYREKCLKLLMLLQKLCPLPVHSFVQQCIKFQVFITKNALQECRQHSLHQAKEHGLIVSAKHVS